MRQQGYHVVVALPSTDEFAQQYPHYGPRGKGEGRPFFDLVMRPQTFVEASVMTRLLRIPAVTAVAEEALTLAGGELADTDKQFIGALMCSLMEANGFRKTGRKGSVPHPAWNKGEIYVETDRSAGEVD